MISSFLLIIVLFFSITFNECYSKTDDSIINLTKEAEHLHEIGKYQEALNLLLKAETMCIKVNGPENYDRATILNNIAACYGDNGDWPNAITFFNKAIKIYKKSLSESDPYLIYCINRLATAYLMNEEYDKALTNYELAKSKSEKVFGLNHTDTAMALDNLACFYSYIGDYEKAVPIHQRAIDIEEKNGDSQKKLSARLSNLAMTYRSLGNLNKSLEIMNKAILLNSQKEDLISQENALALIYFSLGNYDKATQIREKYIKKLQLGNQDPYLAGHLINLGACYKASKKFDQASNIIGNGLEILKNYGINDSTSASAFRLMAEIKYLGGDIVEAQKYAIREISLKNDELQKILYLDERSRLQWYFKNNSFEYAQFIDAKLIADLSIQRKGIILDSISKDRSLMLSEAYSRTGKNTFNRIKSCQFKLAKIIFEESKVKEINQLKEEIGRLQRELFSDDHRVRQESNAIFTIANVIPSLAGGSVLIDFIQFKDYKLEGEEAICLGAIITTEDNKPAFVRIDGGVAIIHSIDALRAAISQGNAAEVEAQTKFLSEKLWQPVAAKIPEGAKRLFICPDANLNFLSFAALLESDDRFVAEKYPISYIGSARDLAKKPSEKISKSMAIFANPQFDASGKNSKTTEMVAMRSAEADVFGSIALPPLPGTETEAQSLGSLATESGWNVKSALGKDATELSVRNTKKPGVLHLATHGFYLNSFTPPAPEGSRGMSVVGINETTEEKKKNEKGVDPMRASGVALTGAQNTLSSWSQRKAPDPETDGVLTAEEVGALRLDGTWMVVLSACETGVGEARSGEGVFGLRRAFMIAGAENLLMTLWPVADETTAKIMADFYKEAFATGDAAGSLAKVQRDWLVKLRQERGLLAAIREAGPFAMVTMTAPSEKREFVEGKIETASEPKSAVRSDKILSFEAAVAKADSGNAYAQAIVSIYYGLGFECEQDDSKSKEYVMLSAKQQNPLGIYRLAEMRQTGEGMEQNSDQALQLMRKAKPGLQKLSNDPYALTALATIYERENPSSPKVRELLTKASEMGYEPAQKKLSQINQ